MEIEFYFIETGKVLPRELTEGNYFVMNDKVFRDNGRTDESQCAVVGFDDYIEKVPSVSWRVVGRYKICPL